MGDDNRRRLELRDMEPPPSPPSYESGLIPIGMSPFSLSQLDGEFDA